MPRRPEVTRTCQHDTNCSWARITFSCTTETLCGLFPPCSCVRNSPQDLEELSQGWESLTSTARLASGTYLATAHAAFAAVTPHSQIAVRVFPEVLHRAAVGSASIVSSTRVQCLIICSERPGENGIDRKKVQETVALRKYSTEIGNNTSLALTRRFEAPQFG